MPFWIFETALCAAVFNPFPDGIRDVPPPLENPLQYRLLGS